MAQSEEALLVGESLVAAYHRLNITERISAENNAYIQRAIIDCEDLQDTPSDKYAKRLIHLRRILSNESLSWVSNEGEPSKQDFVVYFFKFIFEDCTSSGDEQHWQELQKFLEEINDIPTEPRVIYLYLLLHMHLHTFLSVFDETPNGYELNGATMLDELLRSLAENMVRGMDKKLFRITNLQLKTLLYTKRREPDTSDECLIIRLFKHELATQFFVHNTDMLGYTMVRLAKAA